MGAFLTRATQNAQLTRRQACESVVLLRLRLSCFCVPVAAMVNCRITKDFKERAAALAAIGYDAPTVADILGVPGDSVKRWVRNVATYGAVQRKILLCSRKQILSTRIIEEIHGLVCPPLRHTSTRSRAGLLSSTVS